MVSWLIKAEKFIAEDMHVWPKKMLRRCYVLADLIIFVYKVPCIFLHCINVDEVSWITLKNVLQSAMELLQVWQLSLLQSAMDSYYKLRQLFYYKARYGLLKIATGITKCDGFITNATGITKCDDYYKLRQYIR